MCSGLQPPISIHTYFCPKDPMTTRKTVRMMHTTAMMRISHHGMMPEGEEKITIYHFLFKMS